MIDLIQQWKKDTQAPFKGWDFSYLQERWKEDWPDLGYQERAAELLHQADSALDMGTGGGEFLERLKPFPKKMVAIEFWPPNVQVAQKRLLQYGIEVLGVSEGDPLPFDDGVFDLIINRQSSYQATEVIRVLKGDGLFLAQQVAADNLFDLAAEFGIEKVAADWDLKTNQQKFEELGVKVHRALNWEGQMQFNDVGALVYYLTNVPWVVPSFSVERYSESLLRLHDQIQQSGPLAYTQKRFLLEVEKVG